MSIKLNAQSGGSVALDAPTQTTSSADVSFKLPVADGSAGQVLQTDGSGNLSWVTITDTNSWVKLATTTVTSNTSNVQFQNTITGAFDTYKTYIVVYSNVRPAVDDCQFRLRIFDGGNEFSNTNNYQTKLQTDQGNYNITDNFTRLTYNGVGNDVNGSAIREDVSGIIYMTGFPANQRWKGWSNSVFEDNAGGVRRQDTGTRATTESVTTGLKFYFDNGDIALGTFTLYGLVQ